MRHFLRLLSVVCTMQLCLITLASPTPEPTFRIAVPVPTWHSGSYWPSYRLVYITLAASRPPLPDRATPTNSRDARPRESPPRRTNLTSGITTSPSVFPTTTSAINSTDTYVPPAKPVYQCFYHENLVTYCQILSHCRQPLVRSQQTLWDNSTFYGYPCGVNPTRIPYSIDSGIATLGFIDLLKQRRNESGLLFICQFSTTDPPYNEPVFVCAAPVRCRSSANAFGSCSGGLPWFGTWTGNLSRGLSGTILNEAVSQK